MAAADAGSQRYYLLIYGLLVRWYFKYRTGEGKCCEDRRSRGKPESCGPGAAAAAGTAGCCQRLRHDWAARRSCGRHAPRALPGPDGFPRSPHRTIMPRLRSRHEAALTLVNSTQALPHMSCPTRRLALSLRELPDHRCTLHQDYATAATGTARLCCSFCSYSTTSQSAASVMHS